MTPGLGHLRASPHRDRVQEMRCLTRASVHVSVYLPRMSKSDVIAQAAAAKHERTTQAASNDDDCVRQEEKRGASASTSMPDSEHVLHGLWGAVETNCMPLCGDGQ